MGIFGAAFVLFNDLRSDLLLVNNRCSKAESRLSIRGLRCSVPQNAANGGKLNAQVWGNSSEWRSLTLAMLSPTQ
jgi:hypothetical protein